MNKYFRALTAAGVGLAVYFVVARLLGV